MKELANQYKPQICPLQRDLSLVILSHLANGKLDNLDSNAFSVINNLSAPSVEFEFPNEDEASKTVVELVKRTLDIFWGQSYPKNVKDLQLINNVRLLKKQGISRTDIVERLSLHFRWRLNSQKI